MDPAGEISVSPGWRLVVSPSSEHFASGEVAPHFEMERIQDTDRYDMTRIRPQGAPLSGESTVEEVTEKATNPCADIPTPEQAHVCPGCKQQARYHRDSDGLCASCAHWSDKQLVEHTALVQRMESGGLMYGCSCGDFFIDASIQQAHVRAMRAVPRPASLISPILVTDGVTGQPYIGTEEDMARENERYRHPDQPRQRAEWLAQQGAGQNGVPPGECGATNLADAWVGERERFTCNRTRGHGGRHEQRSNGVLVRTWVDERDTEPGQEELGRVLSYGSMRGFQRRQQAEGSNPASQAVWNATVKSSEEAMRLLERMGLEWNQMTGRWFPKRPEEVVVLHNDVVYERHGMWGSAVLKAARDEDGTVRRGGNRGTEVLVSEREWDRAQAAAEHLESVGGWQWRYRGGKWKWVHLVDDLTLTTPSGEPLTEDPNGGFYVDRRGPGEQPPAPEPEPVRTHVTTTEAGHCAIHLNLGRDGGQIVKVRCEEHQHMAAGTAAKEGSRQPLEPTRGAEGALEPDPIEIPPLPPEEPAQAPQPPWEHYTPNAVTQAHCIVRGCAVTGRNAVGFRERVMAQGEHPTVFTGLLCSTHWGVLYPYLDDLSAIGAKIDAPWIELGP